MNTPSIAPPPRPTLNHAPEVDPRVMGHYRASAALYRRWSPVGHLHFGWWAWPMDPFGRRAMLEEMAHRVTATLQPVPGHRLADLGCGYGATARAVARRHDLRVEAFTVVPEQAAEGISAAKKEGVDVTMHLRDFRDTGLLDASVDGVYAIESMCYAAGHGKGDVLREAARILKPGGRLAVADGFVLKSPEGYHKRMLRTVERGWALPCFPRREPFLRELRDAGFHQIRVQDLSWRVVPSAVQGLVMTATTCLRHALIGPPLTALERAHLRSCLLGIFLGTQRDLFSLLMITAVKG